MRFLAAENAVAAELMQTVKIRDIEYSNITKMKIDLRPSYLTVPIEPIKSL